MEEVAAIKHLQEGRASIPEELKLRYFLLAGSRREGGLPGGLRCMALS